MSSASGMRILADESVPGPVIQALRDCGHDVVAVKEIMRGVSDPVILDHAKAEARLVVTFDKNLADQAVRFATLR